MAESERTPAAVQRAIDRWGATVSDLALLHFADLIAGGIKPADAYQTVRPASSESSAGDSASLLLAHPTIAARVSQSVGKLPARELARASVPGALQRLYEIATGATGAPDAVQAKAIDSLLDRGGLPRTTDVTVSAVAVATGAIERVLAVAVAPDDRDALPAHRDQWAKLLPESTIET